MIGEREFFELWKRVIAGSYKDASGMPALTSKDFDPPKKAKIVKSAGAKWTRLFIGFPTHIATPDGRQIDFINGKNPGDLSADTSRPWYSSTTGSAKLWTPGEWHVKTPLVGADVEGTFAPLVMRAAPSGFDSQSITDPGLIGPIGNSPTGGSVDLVRVGGTVQTGADLGAFLIAVLAKLAPLTWSAVTLDQVVAADNAIIGANAARRGLVFLNLDPAKKIAVGTRNPMTALSDGNIALLQPGDVYRTGPLDCETTAGIRAYGEAGGVAANLATFEGT